MPTITFAREKLEESPVPVQEEPQAQAPIVFSFAPTAEAASAPPIDPLAIIFGLMPSGAPPALEPLAPLQDLPAWQPEPLPFPEQPILDLLEPPPEPFPEQPILEVWAPSPEPFQEQPALDVSVAPIEAFPEQPIFTPPLVIQPEDEPPRRPIPIVRVARSKSNPNGNGLENLPQTNGHDVSVPLPQLQPQLQPQPQPPAPASAPELFAAPVQLAVPPARPVRAPVPRPRPPVRPAVEQVAQAPLPWPETFLPEPEPQEVRPTGPMAALAERRPVERMPLRRPKFDENAWLAVRIFGRNFEFSWRSRLARCLTCETVAILVLVGAVFVGVTHRTTDDPLNLISRILAIAAAVVVAIVPVLFYGLPDRVPRDSR